MATDTKDCGHVCKCDCHLGMSMHFMPCCDRCPNCKKNIPNGKQVAHEVHCHPEAK